MCNYTQRKYSCGHCRWIASKWCQTYVRSQKRCATNVTHFEDRAEELCSDCRPKEYPPWENLIKRPEQRTY